MLDSAVKKKLLKKIDDLITEKKESESLREEFINWFNSGKPFEEVMNDSEKEILKKYPNIIVRRSRYINLYSPLRWGIDSSIVSCNIFNHDEKSLLEEDNASFYSFNLITYPAIFDINYTSNILIKSNKKELFKIMRSKVNHIVKVRKKYLKKREFIKRVLDSRDLTLTILKNNYKDIYNLLNDEKSS